MKVKGGFLLLLSSALLLFSGCAINSGLTIDPGNEFILGGNENSGFKASVTNEGTTAVTILERKADGTLSNPGSLEPGESTKVNYGRNSAAIFRNETEFPAYLKVRVTGDTGLSMSYDRP